MGTLYSLDHGLYIFTAMHKPTQPSLPWELGLEQNEYKCVM